MNIVKEMSKAQLFVQNIEILFSFQQSRFVAFCATLLNRVRTHEKLRTHGEFRRNRSVVDLRRREPHAGPSTKDPS